MALKLFSRKRNDSQSKVAGRADRPSGRAAAEYRPAKAREYPQDGLKRAVELGRLGVILSGGAEWAGQAEYAACRAAAVAAIDEHFGLVPDGLVSIPLAINDEPGCSEEDLETAPYLLARQPVTQAEYQRFVDDGGYQNLELWPEDMWPHLVSFKDLTGEFGPRFWRGGRHDERLADHPVVGICHCEAEAYARWAGYRLPTEAEWQMAATWHIRSEAPQPRRYPWGDALDLETCNIWHSGHGHTLPVNACPGGAAPNGVLQLVGNVWEWTATDFVLQGTQGATVVGDMPMKSIRGGAFDTYFAWQATGKFRTGLVCLARSHNVGFRCALDFPSE